MRTLLSISNKLNNFFLKYGAEKKLIIINSHNKLDLIVDAIRQSSGFLKAGTTIFCFKARIPPELAEFKDFIKISEDYLERTDYEEIDRHVFKEASKNWDMELGRIYSGIFKYKGIELARLAEYDIQLFLLFRVKALAVLDKVMRETAAKAVFIIDSNMELKRFDKFMKRQYGASSYLADISDMSSPINILRKRLASFISGIIDRIASLITVQGKGLKLIDIRLFNQFASIAKDGFIFIPLEEGIRLRLAHIMSGRGYIPFDTDFLAGSASFSKSKNVIDAIDISPSSDVFTFKGIPYLDIVENTLKNMISHDFPRMKKNIDIFLEIHKKYSIKTVILRNDLRNIEKTVVLAAKKNSIKTIMVQHGILAEENGHDAIFADIVAAWGQYTRSWYKRFGNDPEKIKVVGGINFDNVCHYLKSKRNLDPVNRLGLKKRNYLAVLITPCPEVVKHSAFETDDVTYNLIRDVLEAIRAMGDTNLVVKLHPNQKLEDFKNLIKEEDKDLMAIIDNIDLNCLIDASNVVIISGSGSTVGLSAAIMNKPLIVVNLSKRRDLVPFVKNAVALGAYRVDDIKRMIDEALRKESTKARMDAARLDFIRETINLVDGLAENRLLDLVRNT